MAKRRLTGFSRFVMAMLLIIPAAIIGSLWLNNEEISVDNITNPNKWTEKTKPKTDVEERKDIKVIRNDNDIKDKEVKIKPDEDSQPNKKRNLKDLLKDKLDKKNKGETERQVKDNNNVVPVGAGVKALQARISRLEDDLAEKDARIEKLYQQKEANNGNACKATRDSLRLIQGKLENLKRALN